MSNATAPWKDQPTPMVDRKNDQLVDGLKQYRAMYGELVDNSRAIEQRMRHAEALLTDPRRLSNEWSDWAQDRMAHIDAAKEMDGAK